jgi:hypothetical protein
VQVTCAECLAALASASVVCTKTDVRRYLANATPAASRGLRKNHPTAIVRIVLPRNPFMLYSANNAVNKAFVQQAARVVNFPVETARPIKPHLLLETVTIKVRIY